MDTNIDPSIAELELFRVATPLGRTEKSSAALRDDGNVGHDGHDERDGHDVSHVSLPNVFQLNEYVSHNEGQRLEDNHGEGEDTTTAEAALNMIQFNSFDDGHVRHVGGLSEYPHQHMGRFLHGSTVSSMSHDNKVYGGETRGSGSTVRMVPYNPAEKTKRLGRPRKHLKNTLATPENSSSQNYNEAILSKFRLDRLPLEGPGSRGGRLAARRAPKGRVTHGLLSRRKQQALLTSFTTVDSAGKRSSTVTLTAPKTSSPENEREKSGNHQHEEYTNLISPPSTNKPSPEHGQSEKENENQGIELVGKKTDESGKGIKAEVESLQKPSSPKKRSTTQNLLPEKIASLGSSVVKRKKYNSPIASVSRTSVKNNRHKASRQMPGPLLGLYYDLYDENVMQAHQNEAASSEPLALGFPLKFSPFAGDIMFIIMFLDKFRSKIFDDHGDILGPQDIEEGLGLNEIADNSEDNNSVIIDNIKHKEVNSNVSLDIDTLFYRLLTLVLNKKRSVKKETQLKALSELKSSALSLGLPQEWRDDSSVYEEQKLEVEQYEVLDSKSLENNSDTISIYQAPLVKDNPFDSLEFEKFGLSGIRKPWERLIMLRTTIQWCLQNSDTIRGAIYSSIQSQDGASEKQTYYVARAIHKGFKNTEDVKKEVESRIRKKYNAKKSLKNSDGMVPPIKYSDPTSNPVTDSLNLRLNQFFVCDAGFNVGRFYLCRMADSENGGLASVEQMRQVWSSTAKIELVSSKFKLYVEDVHGMLKDALEQWGPEFDDDGNVFQRSKTHQQGYFHEVASNTEQLRQFITCLSHRLGITSSKEEKVIPPISMLYKSLTNMHNYLTSLVPLLEAQEVHYEEIREQQKLRVLSETQISLTGGSKSPSDSEHSVHSVDGKNNASDESELGSDDNLTLPDEAEGDDDVYYDEEDGDYMD